VISNNEKCWVSLQIDVKSPQFHRYGGVRPPACQLGRPREPKKRIRKIYIPELVKNARPVRVPLTKEQKEMQKHAREVVDNSRLRGSRNTTETRGAYAGLMRAELPSPLAVATYPARTKREEPINTGQILRVMVLYPTRAYVWFSDNKT
jgi:hypothetical protein